MICATCHEQTTHVLPDRTQPGLVLVCMRCHNVARDGRLCDVEPTGPPPAPLPPLIANPPGRAAKGAPSCGNCAHHETVQHAKVYHHCTLIATGKARRARALRPGMYRCEVRVSTIACERWERAK